MSFLITVEVCDLEHVFLNFVINDSSKDEVSIFSTLVLLLIQILILFFLSLSFFVGGFAASVVQRVG